MLRFISLLNCLLKSIGTSNGREPQSQSRSNTSRHLFEIVVGIQHFRCSESFDAQLAMN